MFPVTVIVQMRPKALDLMVNGQPDVNCERVHVGVSAKRPPASVLFSVKEVSAGLKPEPVRETVWPVRPTFGVNVTIGPPVIVNGAKADGPVAFVTVTK